MKMWNTESNFGGGGGGGGFLDSSVSSPSVETGERKRERRAENIVPVTIRQILESNEDFKIGEVSVHIVTFVALVKNIDLSSTKVTYLLEDTTGQIETVLWLEGPMETTQPPLNSYIRVTGTIRRSQGKRHIIIFNFYPITDMNELTVHLLEIIDVHQNAPDWVEHDENAPPMPMSGMKNSLSNSMMAVSNPVDDGLSCHAPADPRQKMVLKVIADAAVEIDTGVDIRFIARKLVGRLNEQQVREVTEFLLNEGFIFSTVDDEHFTVTR